MNKLRLSYGALSGTYTYNAFGQRTAKTTTTTTNYRHDQQGSLIAELDASGNTVTEYLYDDQSLIAMVDAAGNLTRVHYDYLGTPRRATDNSGSVVWAWDGSAFGKDQPTGSITLNHRFLGQYFDQETGLHQNWNRTYHAGTGRYLESDPIGLEGGVNLYSYVKSNPLINIDPLGLESVSVGFGGSFHYGPGGVSAFTSVGFDSKGKACFQFTKCGQVGFGLFGGLGANVEVSNNDFCDGNSRSEGEFAEGGSILGASGSVVRDNNGSISGSTGYGGVGGGAAIGRQFCSTRTICIN